MNTKQGSTGGRRRRHHSAEFKAKVVEECTRLGVSMAAVALAHGLNANLLRRWVVEKKSIGPTPTSGMSPPQLEFLALPLVIRKRSRRHARGQRYGLARVVSVFGCAHPYHAYVFTNRRANRIKVLVHDGLGIWLCARRLHQGRVVWPKDQA